MQRRPTKVRLTSKWLANAVPMAKALAGSLTGKYASKTVSYGDALVVCKLTPFDRTATILDATELVISSRAVWMGTGITASDIRGVINGEAPKEVGLREVASSYATMHKSGIPYEFTYGGVVRRLELDYYGISSYLLWVPAGTWVETRNWFYIMGDR